MGEKPEASKLKSFFDPKSVAAVGASRNPKKAGFVILKNLLSFGFGGRVFPVNPEADQILGLKAFSRVDSIPEDVETVIVATPVGSVPVSWWTVRRRVLELQ